MLRIVGIIGGSRAHSHGLNLLGLRGVQSSRLFKSMCAVSGFGFSEVWFTNHSGAVEILVETTLLEVILS